MENLVSLQAFESPSKSVIMTESRVFSRQADLLNDSEFDSDHAVLISRNKYIATLLGEPARMTRVF